jgi:hypothetical protein
MKISDIISQVENVREGESIVKSPSEFKSIYEKRRLSKLPVEDVTSPMRKELGRLQDSGLGQTLPDLPEGKLVGQ